MDTFSCINCKTKTIIEYKNYSFWESGGKHTISNLKFYVCPECGEEYIDSETSRIIDRELEKIQENE
ncbi:hypothetical protein Psfp_03631 [Pelotomaculum sp. FP]|uniref:YgiT-type zinc finger protein n=1 Tax=Pelotomaculum sp. FP TaxID=261474 RepID=UPI001066BBAC|nr:YgiT-type zinc finger protein [Pelotomaculum sp. FP]TEB12893.1 hypothetical protein Psfp_03631 [Pelotomaculum sp. FP]